jgi:DNA-binding transcriptional LysR family regulator
MPYDGRLLSGVTVLMAVVEAGSIVRAAEALGLSASGVSRALSRLEARVGARLLNRTTRSLTLTDEGRRFYERVGPHLDSIEEAAIEASGSANVCAVACGSTSTRSSLGSCSPVTSQRS